MGRAACAEAPARVERADPGGGGRDLGAGGVASGGGEARRGNGAALCRPRVSGGRPAGFAGAGRAPSVSRARPPVGWHSTAEQPLHSTTVWLWLNTVVMLKQPCSPEAGGSVRIARCTPRKRAPARSGGLAARSRRLRGGAAPACLALDVHEEGVGRLHEALQLVLALLVVRRRVQQVQVRREHLQARARVKRVVKRQPPMAAKPWAGCLAAALCRRRARARGAPWC